MRSLSIEEPYSKLFQSVREFVPATYRLDVVADLVNFLNHSDDGLWMVKQSNSNQGKGVEMCANISHFKRDLLEGKDKWADNEIEHEQEGDSKIDYKKQDLKHLVKDLKDVIVQRYIEEPCLY